MPIFVEDKYVKLGGVVLPGVFKNIEITQEAAVDEIEVEGAAVKPKQAVGYEDATIKLELIVDASPGQTADAKIAKLNSLFRKKGQEIPQPTDIVCKDTTSAGISKVIFQKLNVKQTNKSDQYAVTLEFCQYVPFVITATTATTATGSTSPTQQMSSVLSADYQQYLESQRGTAPKTAQSPAVDDRPPPPYQRWA